MKKPNACLATAKALLAAACVVATALPAQAATQSFDVDAKTNSTAFSSGDAAPLDTGLVIHVGDLLEISASGSWNGGGGCPDVGPLGANCYGNDPNTGFNYFSLVGRIGTGGYFYVGDSYAGVATNSGRLYLAFLDSDSFNNSGVVTALVGVSPVPEPAGLALMAAGLGAVAMVARRRRQRAA